MPCLLLNLVGSQSWGISSYFKQRDTAAEPTQSGVYGLIEAAIGLDRSESYPDLAALRFGVRVDRPGHLAVDFQTAQNVMRANGRSHKNEVIHKHYLADAHFMVVLEGESSTLETVQQALLTPRRPIYLGRRAFPPTAPVILPDCLQPEALETVIVTYPWCASHFFPWSFLWDGAPLRAVIDDPHGFETRNDRRLGAPTVREFIRRPVRTYLVEPILAEPFVPPSLEISPPLQAETPPPSRRRSPSARSRPARQTSLAPAPAPTELFETQLIFANPVFDPLDMGAIHKLLLDALRIGRPQTKVPVLFRLDALTDDRFKLVIRSTRRADWSRPPLFEVIEQTVEPFRPPTMSPGDQFTFSVRVNPIKKSDGKIIGLRKAADQVAWLHRKAQERGGFNVLDLSQHLQEPPRRAKRDIFFVSANFEGVGQLVDAALFKECLWRGLAAKGLFAGFNMLQIVSDGA